MSTYSKIIGNNIRIFRRARRMTLETLAERIHKSKATVGKYEQGAISIDVDTLGEIASVLGVSPSQLLIRISPEKASSAISADEILANEAAGEKQYLYLFDGRTNRIVKSLLICSSGDQDEAALFYSVASFDEPNHCRALYLGKRQMRDFVTNYLLMNQIKRIEYMFLSVMQSLDSPTYSTGLISGISSRTFLPASTKCILSTVPLPENEELKNNLLLTKADISLTRRYNMFMVDQSGPWN